MWYVKLIESLAPKIKGYDPKNDKEVIPFIHKFFDILVKVSRPTSIDAEVLFGLIDKMFNKYANAENDSILLADFSKHLMGLSSLYIKLACDLAIWNVDFIKEFRPDIAKAMGYNPPIRVADLNAIELSVYHEINFNTAIDIPHVKTILLSQPINYSHEIGLSFDSLWAKSDYFDELIVEIQKQSSINMVFESEREQATVLLDETLQPFSLAHKLSITKTLSEKYDKCQFKSVSFAEFKSDLSKSIPLQVKKNIKIDLFLEHLQNIKEKVDYWIAEFEDNPSAKLIRAINAASDMHKSITVAYESYSKSSLTANNLQEFKELSINAIHIARPELERHRGFKLILGNLVIAILGLGVGFVVAGCINLIQSQGRDFLFFKETDSAQKINQLEKTIKEIESMTAPAA